MGSTGFKMDFPLIGATMRRNALKARIVQTVTLALVGSALAYGQNGGKKNNIAPTVGITAPAAASTFIAPATIGISVSATDSDGSIKKVEFFANSTLLGTMTQPPYNFNWTNVGTGTYSLKARATDNVNLKTDSSAISVTVSAQADVKSVSGAWSPLINFPNPAGCSGCAFLPIHMSLLPNGKVLMWQDDNPAGPRGSQPSTVAYLWDVGTNTFTPVNNTTTDMFCSGHAFLPDGTLLAAGGHKESDNNGTTTTNLYDFNTGTWTLSNFNMNQGRWYPTVTTLANGDMLVVSGNITSTLGVNRIPEVWQTGLGGGYRQLNTAAISLPLYPWMHVAPNGKVFNSGPGNGTRYLDTTGTGAWTAVGGGHVFTGTRDYGSSVMYDDGKVLVMGGSNPPLSTAELVDLNVAAPKWQSTGSMKYARRQMSATILPDGKVLAMGGSSSTGGNDATLAVLPAEMWNPASGVWSTMASMQVPRMYHSNALLLPDGRVISAGGGRPAAIGTTDQPNAQIYSPPYLFKTDGSPAIRPVISSVPTNLGYGQSFTITTPDAASITQVIFIRLGSFTHSFDENQRINRLSFTSSSGAVNAVVPVNGNLCPPGHYMLFILKNGVPSIARIINVH
jgi:hypothetical protein